MDCEVRRRHLVEVLPSNRERDRRAGPNPWTVRGHDRGATNPCRVQEYLALPFLLDEGGSAQIRVDPLGAASHRAGGCIHVLRFTAPSVHEVSVSGPLRANHVVAVRDATLAGLGIGVMPQWLADEALATGALRRVLPDAAMLPIVLRAVYHRDSRGTARITALLEYLQRHLPRRLETKGLGEPPAVRAKRAARSSSNRRHA